MFLGISSFSYSICSCTNIHRILINFFIYVNSNDPCSDFSKLSFLFFVINLAHDLLILILKKKNFWFC